MSVEPVSRENLVKRLKMIEGQVRGIQKMIEEERECESILTQLAAIRSAVDSVGSLLLNNYMTVCFRDESFPQSEQIKSLARAVAIWGALRGDEGA